MQIFTFVSSCKYVGLNECQLLYAVTICWIPKWQQQANFKPHWLSYFSHHTYIFIELRKYTQNRAFSADEHIRKSDYNVK